MKKALLALFMIALFVTFACRSAEEKIDFTATDENPERCREEPPGEVKVEIAISNSDVGGCSFIDPGEITISKTQKVRWCIVNNCNIGPVQVMIDTFVNVDNAADQKPFGNREDPDNIFFTNPIRYTKAKHVVSKAPHPDAVTRKYKYYIKLFGPSGELLQSVDPHVVISDS